MTREEADSETLLFAFGLLILAIACVGVAFPYLAWERSRGGSLHWNRSIVRDFPEIQAIRSLDLSAFSPASGSLSSTNSGRPRNRSATRTFAPTSNFALLLDVDG